MKISLKWIVLFVALTVGMIACQEKDKSLCIDIKLSPEILTLQVGEESSLELTGDLAGQTPKWSVGNMQVATVKAGVVKSLSTGETWVEVQVGSATARSRIVVQQASPKNITFADPNLKGLILAAHPTIDANKDGEISVQEAQGVKALRFAHESKEDIKPEQKIASVAGLEHFTALDTLDLKNQFVTDASPVFALSSLKQLHLGGNDISSIELQKMTVLTDLRLYGNARLTTIDLRQNTKLEQIYLQRTGITHLDLTMLRDLKQAYINQAQLSEIKFAGLPLLERIDIVRNKLSTIQIADLPKLKELHANNNALSSVTLSGLPSLERLNLYGNQLETINLGELPKLMFLFIFDNKLKSIDLKGLPMLFGLQVGQNPLKEIDLSKNKIIRNLDTNEMSHIELINLKNDAFNEEAEYDITGNTSLKKVIVDAGQEYDFVKKIFAKNPSVSVVTE